MKLKQKIGFSLVTLALFISTTASIIQPGRVNAAETLDTKLNGCAEEIAAELAGSSIDSNSICKFFNNSNPPKQCGPSQLYGNGAFEDTIAQQTGYKLPYRDGGYNDPKNPPKTVTLIDGDQAITPPSGIDQGKYSTFTYTGQQFETPGYKLDYWVYQSNYNTKFKILLALRPSGDAPIVLAMVNTDKNIQGDDIPVCAYHLNLLATLSTPTGGTIPPVPATGTGVSCESNFSSGFEWIICPSLRLADKAAGGFSGFVEGQLTICTGQSSTNPSENCANSNSILGDTNHTGPKNAWTIFKNIASALLVLILLIAVISQALGIGPFDAYTIRKALPKLVAAVILMQISWYMLKYAIDLSNDLGKGIQNLLYAPFGGGANMHLDKLVSNGVQIHSVGTNDTWAFFATLAGAGALLANLPGLLTLALFIIMALVVAFIVLLLRKIFVLALVILAPLAFILWILPGTSRYWKMWADNFTKLLLMFPMIMALVATGRVFAYIVSGGSNQASASLVPHMAITHLGPLPVLYIGSVKSFVDIAVIVFAYFAPYFLLPQTFKWGGTFMSATSQAVQNRVAKPITDKSKEGIKGMTERYHGAHGKAYDPNATWGKRVFRRVGSGHFIPTKRSQRLAIAEGDKWSQERDDQALGLIKRKGEIAMKEGYVTLERNKKGEMLDAGGNVTTDVSQAAKKRLIGTQAMKQMWVDLAEEGRDSYEKKMAIRQLTATASWPEIQNSYTKNGKKVIDTAAWAPSITTSPEEYPKVLRSRIDAAPHIVDIGEKALEQAKVGGRVFTSEIEERDFKSQKRIHYSFESQMSNEDFATQSDGFWEEAGRAASITDAAGNLTAESLAIQDALKKRLEAIHDIGGTAPQHLLGHLVGGGVEKHVDLALHGTPTAAGGPGTIRGYAQP